MNPGARTHDTPIATDTMHVLRSRFVLWKLTQLPKHVGVMEFLTRQATRNGQVHYKEILVKLVNPFSPRLTSSTLTGGTLFRSKAGAHTASA